MEPPPFKSQIKRAVGIERLKRIKAARQRVSARARRLAWRVGVVLVALVTGAVVAGPYLLVCALRLVFGRPSTRSTLSDFTMRVNAAIDCEEAAADLRILVPTATAAIVAEILALAAIRKDPLPSIAFIFHEDPRFYKQWYRPLDLESLCERLAGSGWAPGMGFYATNRRLAQSVSAVLGADVISIGDVLDPRYVDRLARISEGGCDPNELEPGEAEILAQLQAHRDAGHRLAVCPGAVRHDKGLHQLPALLKAMRDDGADFRLVLQAPMTSAATQDEVLEAGTRPGIDVIARDLSEVGYLRLLAMADVVLLPYDANSYAMRISRVYLESALSGKSILLSRGMACEDDRTHVAAMAVDQWEQWTKAARVLIAEARGTEVQRSIARRRDTGTWRAWWGVADWLTRPAPRVRPAKPVLYVRPSWFASGSATAFDQHLRFLAQERLPVVEAIIEPDCAAEAREHYWNHTLVERAGTFASVTCWSSPRSGLVGIARLLGLGLLRLYKGSHARQLAETRRLCPLPRAVTLAGRRGYGFVLVNHYFHQPFAAAFEGRAPLWIETHDVQSRQMIIREVRNGLSGNKEPFDRLLADELSYLRKADVVGAISVEEAAFFRQRLGNSGNRVILCQPYIPSPPRLAADETVDVLIVASDNPTNVMNLRWFVTEVVPLLPALLIRVVGTIGQVAALEGIESSCVEYTGPVRSVAPHYAAAKVVALPIVAGAGIAIKTLEAMAAGKAIVATPLAFRGLPHDAFLGGLLAEAEPAGFADAIARLISEPAALEAAEQATALAYETLGLKRRFAQQMSQAIQRVMTMRDVAAGARDAKVHDRGFEPCSKGGQS
jgi:glycosyltransferase involved in cell wall biosynthesis